jgi:hypothetical protein
MLPVWRRLAALTAAILAVSLLTVTPAVAEPLPSVTTGNYAYDQAPNAGAVTDAGQTGLLPFGTGALADAQTTTRAQWVGDGVAKYKQVSVVLDLLRDHPLDHLKLVSNAPNAYYGIKSIAVRARSEGEPDFTALAARPWYGTASPLPAGTALSNTLTVPLNGHTARFVIVTITRLHEYQHMVLNEIAVHPAGDPPGGNPAPALTAEQLRAELAKPTKQVPRPGMVDVGNYYFGVTPDDGVPDSAGGVVPFRYGELFNRDVTRNVGWRGRADAPKTVALVFDLLRDHPLDRIRIVGNAPNQYWGFDEITVTYRPESSETYRVASRAVRPRTELSYTLEVPMSDQVARFVRIEVSRVNQYLHIPLSEVEFAVGDGPVGQDPAPPYAAAQLQRELARHTRMVDRFGQYLYQDWPGKVTSTGQLQQDHRQEWSRLKDVAADRAVHDRYGGVKSLPKQPAEGYFRLRKVDGRWWFVTPDGHLFLLKGVDSVSHDEWGYGTLYKNADGSPRDVFDGLPDPQLYPDAYAVTDRGHTVSFVKANLMAKYGDEWRQDWREVTGRRLLDWGFNGLSKWARDPGLRMPYISQVTAPPDAIRVLWAIDPFDPQFGAKLDRHTDIKALRHDPWLIGYFFDNERGWNTDVVKEVLRRDGSLPAKQAFVDYLAGAYGHDLARVNTLLGTSAGSFEALAATPIDVARVPADDVKAYIRLASRTYYTAVRAAIVKQDPNHLFLGSALVPTWHSSLDWNVGGIDQLDAVSLDVYSDSAAYLAEYEALDKPVLNLEYSFNTSDRGLRAINASVRAESVADRGHKYRAFLQAQAKSPVFVGSGWFVYYDQAVTGRPGDGESFNFGLLNQQDQPYSEMTDIMRDTNLTLELVHYYGTTDLTAQMLAGSITRLDRVERGETRLSLPAVPAAFRLEIASSSHPGVIGLDGSVTPASRRTRVTVELEVTRTGDGSAARTRPITVWVPGA